LGALAEVPRLPGEGPADRRVREVLYLGLTRWTQRSAPLFTLVSRERLAAAYAADPRLPGTMAIPPSRTTPAAYLLDINRWRQASGVSIR